MPHSSQPPATVIGSSLAARRYAAGADGGGQHETRQRRLLAAGKTEVFRTLPCPACGATIDLSESAPDRNTMTAVFAICDGLLSTLVDANRMALTGKSEDASKASAMLAQTLPNHPGLKTNEARAYIESQTAQQLLLQAPQSCAN